jgi:hypothetical protein
MDVYENKGTHKSEILVKNCWNSHEMQCLRARTAIVIILRTHVYGYVYVRMYVCTYVCMYECAYVCTYEYVSQDSDNK